MPRAILILLFYLCFTAQAHADGLGPFDLPPLGSSEFFREMPSFIPPAIGDTSKVKINFTTRILNSWTYNIESSSDEPYLWDGREDYPFEHGSFLSDMET